MINERFDARKTHFLARLEYESSLFYKKKKTHKTYLDWSVHVGLFNTQHNLPGDSDSIEEVVDEAHVVDEGVHVAGAQHEQGGQALRKREEKGVSGSPAAFRVAHRFDSVSRE